MAGLVFCNGRLLSPRETVDVRIFGQDAHVSGSIRGLHTGQWQDEHVSECTRALTAVLRSAIDGIDQGKSIIGPRMWRRKRHVGYNCLYGENFFWRENMRGVGGSGGGGGGGSADTDGRDRIKFFEGCYPIGKRGWGLRRLSLLAPSQNLSSAVSGMPVIGRFESLIPSAFSGDGDGDGDGGVGVEIGQRGVSGIGELGSGVWSVVIPTYNRLPILTKCLRALECQLDLVENGVDAYEVIVVDDGSTDGTVDFLRENEKDFPHVRLIQQAHGGAASARNLGVAAAQGTVIVFIDSDLVVTNVFLRSHAYTLRRAHEEDGDDRAFTYGRVVNTSNFENPECEKFKITDFSAAFFATGNVAISRRRLLDASADLPCSGDGDGDGDGDGGVCGPFDTSFSEYGWEDLELGERLRMRGATLRACPEAVGYHWHPAFDVAQLPSLIEQERQRGKNGVRFYEKHPNLNVRLMIQMTLFHEALWFILTLGGAINERTIAPLLHALVAAGLPHVAAALVNPVLNFHNVQAVKQEANKIKTRGIRPM